MSHPVESGPVLVRVAAPLKVVIMADDPLARAGLTSLVGAALAGSGGAVVTAAQDASAALWDCGPALDARGVAAVFAGFSRVSVPVLALVPEAAHAAPALAAGARGVLVRERLFAPAQMLAPEAARPAPEHILASALSAVAHGLCVLDPALAAHLAAAPAPGQHGELARAASTASSANTAITTSTASAANAADAASTASTANVATMARTSSAPGLDELTARERQVAQLMAEGLSNKRIAAALDISGHTVKFHVNSIMSKLGATTRTEAAIEAVRRGLVVL